MAIPRNAKHDPTFYPKRILQTPAPKESNGDSLLENLQARVRFQQVLTQQDHAGVRQAVTAKVQTSQGFIFIKNRHYILTALGGQGAVPQPAKKRQSKRL